jgi:hypothetical protein
VLNRVPVKGAGSPTLTVIMTGSDGAEAGV